MLESRHRGSLDCKTAKAKIPKRKDGSMLSFFSKAPIPIPPAVTVPLPTTGPRIHAASLVRVLNLPPTPSILQALDALRANVELLPQSIGAADADNALSIFAGDFRLLVPLDTPSNELWEGLSPIFHGVFGYNSSVEDRVKLVQRGYLGLDAFISCMDYFILERNLHDAPAQLKIEQLNEAVLHISGTQDDALGSTNPVPAAIQSSAEHLDERPHRSSPPAIESDDDVVVLDGPLRGNSTRSQPSRCAGFVFSAPPGKHAATEYPFALHATQNLPWSYSSNTDGTLTLRSVKCGGTCITGRTNCSACASLPRETPLAGILERTEQGVKAHSSLPYHPIAGLNEIIKRQDRTIADFRLGRFNLSRRIATQSAALDDHKRFVRAIASGKFENVARLVRVCLGRNMGIRGVLSSYDRAARGLYKPKSYTEEDHLRTVLFWRMGGNRLADLAHRALGLPSTSTVRRHISAPHIIISVGLPRVEEIEKNILASFDGILDLLTQRPRHAVIMFDELAVDGRIRWDDKTNNFVGTCRPHSKHVNMRFDTEDDMTELFRALDEPKDSPRAVHYAKEATVGAIGILDIDTRMYAARPILLSGDCKRESGPEHLRNVVNPTLNAMDNVRPTTKVRVTSIATDGETRRGSAFIQKTFLRILSPDSDIYDLLCNLRFMDLWVGADDLTGDKDYKHVLKRLRNRLLRLIGTMVLDVRITPALIRVHLLSVGLSTQHIDALLRPDDKQDVMLAFNLGNDLWTLPEARPDSSPTFKAARQALRTFGALFYFLIFPYVCVDLSLSEQLEHLSAAAHLALILHRDGGKDALPTLLFVDIEIMIKNAYFCVAKAKVDHPTDSFFLVLLGTDRLEELFGIYRTMIGNDRNVDLLQASQRITGTTQVANILASHPHWDRPPHRADHIKPPSWRGDTSVANVVPLTSWNRGLRRLEEWCPWLSSHIRALDDAYGVSILAPLGELLVHRELDADDNEAPDEEEPSQAGITAPMQSLPTDLEDGVAAEASAAANGGFSNSISVQGSDKPILKARSLSVRQRDEYTASSTDRLKRIADGERYSPKSHVESGIVESDEPFILVSEPIATLVRCEDNLFLAIGEVTDIRLDSTSVEKLGVRLLRERKVQVHFQILTLVPSNASEDPTLRNDWRSKALLRAYVHAPGRLVLPIDPTLSTMTPGSTYFLFNSNDLRNLGAQLLTEVTSSLRKEIPKLA
ncbi:hypothetical protein C8F01DRAFT_1022169, partial [Mycena amicta]